jgi:hypothetical protein
MRSDYRSEKDFKAVPAQHFALSPQQYPQFYFYYHIMALRASILEIHD